MEVAKYKKILVYKKNILLLRQFFKGELYIVPIMGELTTENRGKITKTF